MPGKAAQNDLIKQAKGQGVKRFIASEYGVHPDTTFGRADFFNAKREMGQLLNSSNFPDGRVFLPVSPPPRGQVFVGICDLPRTGWTGIASGFFDDILPALVSASAEKSTIVVRGSGQVRHPFTLRSDIGRVLAETFREPHKYKDSWITVVSAWYTLEQVADRINEVSGRKWTVQRIPTDMKMPILHLAEQNRWDFIPEAATPEDAPVKLGDFEEEAIRPYAKSLL